MASVLSVFTEGVSNKIKTSIFKPSVAYSEVKDFFSEEVEYPRVEIMADTAKAVGYESQRRLKWSVTYNVIGFLKKSIPEGQDSSNWSLKDWLDILNFGMNTVSLVYSTVNERSLYPGFDQIEGFSQVWTDLEVIPGFSAFCFKFNALFSKLDTED